MKRTRILGCCVSAAFLLVVASSVNAQDDSKPPKSFGDLFEVGQTVFLSPASGVPYAFQLLSEEQLKAIEKHDTAVAAKQKRVEQIQLALEMEHRLEQRAALLLETDKLDSELSRDRRYSRYARGSFYEVVEVGQDFVALKREGLQRLVPFHSIRELLRTDEVGVVRLPTRSRDPELSLSGGRTADTRLIELKHIDPKEVVDLLKKLFPDEDLDIQPGDGRIEGNFFGTAGRRIQALIQRLDVKIGE